MDSGYALLLTVVTVAALIAATFFLINQKNALPRGDDGNELSPNIGDDFRTSGELLGGEMLDIGGPAEDADGPIFPSILPSSDSDLWKVWFDQPAQSKGMTKIQFEDSMRVLGTFNTMADFWDRFSNLMHERLPTKSNVRVFQSNIPPLYEDPVNRDGGKWIVVIPKQKSVGVFNEVLAAIVGGKFNCEISGLVLSKKVREDLVSIWTPSGIPNQSLEVLRDSIGDLLETHLGLKPEITFMSHDKKNRINVSGKGEKEKRESPAGGKQAKMKFTGVKPKSPATKPKSPGLKPKSPTMAPVVEENESEEEPSVPVKKAWGAGIPSSIKEAPGEYEESPATAETSPKESSQGSETAPKGNSSNTKVKIADPESDGWEVVQSKPKKGPKGSRKPRF